MWGPCTPSPVSSCGRASVGAHGWGSGWGSVGSQSSHPGVPGSARWGREHTQPSGMRRDGTEPSMHQAAGMASWEAPEPQADPLLGWVASPLLQLRRRSARAFPRTQLVWGDIGLCDSRAPAELHCPQSPPPGQLEPWAYHLAGAPLSLRGTRHSRCSNGAIRPFDTGSAMPARRSPRTLPEQGGRHQPSLPFPDEVKGAERS